jgi:hypothetical protein
MPVIPALGRWKQEDHELEAGLSYTAKLCLKEGGGGENDKAM